MLLDTTDPTLVGNATLLEVTYTSVTVATLLLLLALTAEAWKDREVARARRQRGPIIVATQGLRQMLERDLVQVFFILLGVYGMLAPQPTDPSILTYKFFNSIFFIVVALALAGSALADKADRKRLLREANLIITTRRARVGQLRVALKARGVDLGELLMELDRKPQGPGAQGTGTTPPGGVKAIESSKSETGGGT